MKIALNPFTCWFCLIILLLSCSGEKHFILSNTSSFERKDEAVTINRKILDSLFRKDVSRYFPLIKTETGDTIPSQTDDLDADHKWDELFLLVDFGPFEKKEIQIVLIDTAAKPKFHPRANLRFAKVVERGKIYSPVVDPKRLRSTATELSQAAFQMEGPAWESDRVAFRNYFDARNGIDIYGKVTSKMVLDSVGTGENYHDLQWWGMDILHVGNSLGAGAIAVSFKDSLYRLDLPAEAGFESVSRGPLRVIFRLKYTGWNVGGRLYELTHEISTWGGFYGYQSKISIRGKALEEIELTPGIVNIHSDSLYMNKNHPGFSAIYTHAKQAENAAALGLALVVSNKDFIGEGKAPVNGNGISQSYLARLKVRENEEVKYWFYAGWENSNPEFKSEVQFGRFIDRETEKKNKPILLKLQ